MFSSFLRIRWRSRSSGPSKASSLTWYASGDDSKSVCSLTTRLRVAGGGPWNSRYGAHASVSQFHRVSDALHRRLRDDPRPARALNEDVADVVRPGHDLAPPLADRLERAVQRCPAPRLFFSIHPTSRARTRAV